MSIPPTLGEKLQSNPLYSTGVGVVGSAIDMYIHDIKYMLTYCVHVP